LKLIIILSHGGMVENYKDIFDKYLRSKKLKLTDQRLVILEVVFSLHEHFNVESLHEYIKKKTKSNISIPTIYRTIPLLIDCGLIKKADFSNEKDSFEHTFGHPEHVHIICKLCHKLIEEEDTHGVETEIKKITSKYRFKIADYKLSIEGTCASCLKMNKVTKG